MRSSTALSGLACCAALALAAPEALVLSNGTSFVDTTLVPRNNLLVPRANACSGSSRCSNSQDFKGQCNRALSKVDPNHLYSNGGSGSGTCSGNCGLFVQGQYRAYSWIPFYNTQCTAYGNDLKAAVDKIHANGCQTCGWIVTNQNPACQIKQDFVTGC